MIRVEIIQRAAKIDGHPQASEVVIFARRRDLPVDADHERVAHVEGADAVRHLLHSSAVAVVDIVGRHPGARDHLGEPVLDIIAQRVPRVVIMPRPEPAEGFPLASY